MRRLAIAMLSWFALAAGAHAQTVGGTAPALRGGASIDIDMSRAGRGQTIDGFGTCISGTEPLQPWWQALYFDDLAASIVRFDITPHFKPPYSDHGYNSPWFHNDPPLPGPDGNNARTYNDAADYTRKWAGYSAQIAVMGPDIDRNTTLFDYDHEMPKAAGLLAQLGNQKRAALSDFKLIASLWSPAPWLKRASGHSVSGQHDPLPKDGTRWPFIWNGQFAGGVLDTSGTPRPEFDDAALGGGGATSALVQFTRGLAAYLRGFQRRYGVTLHAISLQNELGFEEFYGSCAYPEARDYIAVLKAARAELDRYDDLRAIRILGPEDVMGGDAYGLWQVASEGSKQPKSLQYLASLASDADALRALDTAAIHGYAQDGISAAGGEPKIWDYWVHGWRSAPAAGLPAQAQGFADYGKASWMTETSGEESAWLAPAGGFPNRGAFSIALKLHQALTRGRQSAWLYWQLTDGNPVAAATLTDATARASAPKYAAVKHFFRYIRPGAVRVDARVTGSDALLASAYVRDASGTLTLVLINTTPGKITATLHVPALPAGIAAFQASTSYDGHYGVASTLKVARAALSVAIPGYGVLTLQGNGKPIAPSDVASVAPLAKAETRGLIAGCGCHVAMRDAAPQALAPGAAVLLAALFRSRRKTRDYARR